MKYKHIANRNLPSAEDTLFEAIVGFGADEFEMDDIVPVPRPAGDEYLDIGSETQHVTEILAKFHKSPYSTGLRSWTVELFTAPSFFRGLESYVNSLEIDTSDGETLFWAMALQIKGQQQIPGTPISIFDQILRELETPPTLDSEEKASIRAYIGTHLNSILDEFAQHTFRELTHFESVIVTVPHMSFETTTFLLDQIPKDLPLSAASRSILDKIMTTLKEHKSTDQHLIFDRLVTDYQEQVTLPHLYEMCGLDTVSELVGVPGLLLLETSTEADLDAILAPLSDAQKLDFLGHKWVAKQAKHIILKQALRLEGSSEDPIAIRQKFFQHGLYSRYLETSDFETRMQERTLWTGQFESSFTAPFLQLLQKTEGHESKQELCEQYFTVYHHLSVIARFPDRGRLAEEKPLQQTGSREARNIRPFTLFPIDSPMNPIMVKVRVGNKIMNLQGVVLSSDVTPHALVSGKRNIFSETLRTSTNTSMDPTQIRRSLQPALTDARRTTLYLTTDPVEAKMIEWNFREIGRLPDDSTSSILSQVFVAYFEAPTPENPTPPTISGAELMKLLTESPETSPAHKDITDKLTAYCKKEAPELDPVFLKVLLVRLVSDKVEQMTAPELKAYVHREGRTHKPHSKITYPRAHSEILVKPTGQTPIDIFQYISSDLVDFTAFLDTTRTQFAIYDIYTSSILVGSHHDAQAVANATPAGAPIDSTAFVKLLQENPDKQALYMRLLSYRTAGLPALRLQTIWKDCLPALNTPEHVLRICSEWKVASLPTAGPTPTSLRVSRPLHDIVTTLVPDQHDEAALLQTLRTRILREDFATFQSTQILANTLFGFYDSESPITRDHILAFIEGRETGRPSEIASTMTISSFLLLHEQRWISKGATHADVMHDLLRAFSNKDFSSEALRNRHPASLWAEHFLGMIIHPEQNSTRGFLAGVSRRAGTPQSDRHTIDLLDPFLKHYESVFGTDFKDFLTEFSTYVIAKGVCMEGRYETLHNVELVIQNESESILGIPIRLYNASPEDSLETLQLNLAYKFLYENERHSTFDLADFNNTPIFIMLAKKFNPTNTLDISAFYDPANPAYEPELAQQLKGIVKRFSPDSFESVQRG